MLTEIQNALFCISPWLPMHMNHEFLVVYLFVTPCRACTQCSCTQRLRMHFNTIRTSC